MIVHFIFLFAIFGLVFFYRKRKEKRPSSRINSLVFILIATIMVLFIGLRGIMIGTDTPTYVTMFEANQWPVANMEYAMPLIQNVVHLFTDKYFIFLSIMSIITLLGVLNVIRKKDFDVEIFAYLYITSFCYLYSASAIRFFCAFSIIMLSFKYMIEKRTAMVLLFVLLAMLFHTSAIVFLPLYFITRIKYTKKNMIIFFAVLIFLTIITEVLSPLVFDLGLFSKYSYVEQEAHVNFGPSIIINLFIIIFALLFHGKIKKYKKEYEFFTKVSIVSFFIDMISIAFRTLWYFRFPVWFIIPIALANIKFNDRKTYIAIYALTLVLYGAYYYYILSNSLPTHNFLNYEFNMELN